jgi:hypothetical protein
MVACNAGVWMCFVKALQQSPSSLPPTVISAAINYISSVGYITDNFLQQKEWLVFTLLKDHICSARIKGTHNGKVAMLDF